MEMRLKDETATLIPGILIPKFHEHVSDNEGNPEHHLHYNQACFIPKLLNLWARMSTTKSHLGSQGQLKTRIKRIKDCVGAIRDRPPCTFLAGSPIASRSS